MIVKRRFVVLMALSLGLALGACTPFSGFVADHVPHWAGGMPDDIPPRPGAPGYQDFIAHKQADTESAKSAAANDKTNAQQAAPSANPAPNDAAVAPGGLY